MIPLAMRARLTRTRPDDLRAAATRVAPWTAAALAVAVLAVAAAWGTNAVGGSDSHCYVGQARMFLGGALSLPPPLSGPVSWPNAAATFVPSGFANDGSSGRAVPLCPAGLSIVMAAFMAVGGDGAWFWVVPLFAAIAVWCTFVLGRRLGNDGVGLAAACLLACSPVFLYQAFQPMSDVPAAALWAASLAAALAFPALSGPGGRVEGSPASLFSGLLAGAAITIRPNLAPLALVPMLLGWRGWRAAAAFIAGVVPGVAIVAALQALMYGSPLRSGYGSLSGLFSLAHVGPNLVRYPTWLIETHTPALALALAAPFVARRPRAAWLLLGFSVVTLGLYLPYVVFGDWSYARFLLPAMPVIAVLLSTAAWELLRRLPRRIGPVVFAVAAVALGALWMTNARDHGVLRVKAVERKYPELGRYAAADLPANAVVFAAQPSGAVRFYAGLPTLSWDAIEPDWLERAAAELVALGHEPYLAIENWETDAFRDRFASKSAFGHLDWPPRAVIGRVISLYRLGDRSSYIRGERIPTTRITWPMK
jgi:hypothetical protein